MKLIDALKQNDKIAKSLAKFYFDIILHALDDVYTLCLNNVTESSTFTKDGTLTLLYQLPMWAPDELRLVLQKVNERLSLNHSTKVDIKIMERSIELHLVIDLPSTPDELQEAVNTDFILFKMYGLI